MAVPGKRSKQTLSTSFAQGSDEDIILYCQPCDRDGLRLPAAGFCVNCEEHLCQSCFNSHKKARPCRNHVLLDKEIMPKTLQIPSSFTADTSFSDDFTEPCSQHKKEIIKYFCHDHDALICGVCATLQHNTCNFNYIPEISRSFVNGEAFQETVNSMGNIVKECALINSESRRTIDKSNGSLNAVFADIRKCKEEINEAFKELEKAVKTEANDMQQKNEQVLQNIETTCEDLPKAVKAQMEILKQLNTPKQADTLFIELKRSQKLMNEYSATLTKLAASTLSITEYQFVRNHAIMKLIETERSLGTIQRKRDLSQRAQTMDIPVENKAPPVSKRTVSSAKAKSTHYENHPAAFVSTPIKTGESIKPEEARSIYMKRPEDRDDCLITGMIVPTRDQLIVADHLNRSIKVFSIEKKTMTSSLVLPESPWDITSVSGGELAVTLPKKQMIQFISKELAQKRSINVVGRCYGIDHHNEKLVVSFLSPAKLQILDMRGNVLTTVRTDSELEDIFHIPNYVQCNNKSIYVSDNGKREILMLNWQGEVTGSYKRLNDPRGINLLSDGSLFACNLKTGTVQKISGDCTRGQAELVGLTDPKALAWSPSSSALYISSASLSKKHDNYVRAFKIQ